MSVPPMTPAELAEATGDRAAAGLPETMTAERFCMLWKGTCLSLNQLAVALNMRGRNAATHLREMADGVRPIPGPTGVALEAIALRHFDSELLNEVVVDALKDAESANFEPDFTTQARYCVRAVLRLLGRPE